MKNILIIPLIMSLFSCCGKYAISKSDPLHLARKEYNGYRLRIDGYYYQYYNGSYFDVTLFFKEGVVLFPMGNKTNLHDVDNYVMNSFVKKDGYKKVMYWWGIFNIDEDTIAFERWYPSEPPYKAYINEGKILNDTTFLITKRYRMVDGIQTEIEKMDDKYHFRQFSPKPDSTNNFIK